MHVVEVERGAELGIARAGEEIEAAVEGEDRIALFDDRLDRREDEDVVVAIATGNRLQLGHRIGHRAGVHIAQIDPARGGKFDRVERRSTVETALIDVGDDEQARLAVFAAQYVVDRRQTHRADTVEDRHLAAVDDVHLVHVAAGRQVVVGVHRADHARQRLGQRGRVEALAGVGEQAVLLHHFGRNHDVGRIAADVLVAVTGRAEDPDRTVGIVQRRLDRELVACLELVGPLGADFNELTAEFVADDDRVIGDIVRNALVIGRLRRGLVRRHAQAIGDNLGEDFIVLDRRQLEGFETEILFSVETDGSSFHGDSWIFKH